MTPELALQEAIVSLLLAASAVTGVVGQKVFDEVPSDNPEDKPPWVYVGPVNRQRIEVGAGCGHAWTLRIRLYAASTKFGRKDAWELGNAVSAALDGQEPALASPYQIAEELRVIQAGDVIEPSSPKVVFLDVTALVAAP